MQNRLTVMPKLAWAAISKVCRDLPRELSHASDQKFCDAMTGPNAHEAALCCFERGVAQASPQALRGEVWKAAGGCGRDGALQHMLRVL